MLSHRQKWASTYCACCIVVRSWKFSLEWINLKSFSIYVYTFKTLHKTITPHPHCKYSSWMINLKQSLEMSYYNIHTHTQAHNSYSLFLSLYSNPSLLFTHEPTECLKNVMQFDGNQFWRIASYSFSHI